MSSIEALNVGTMSFNELTMWNRSFWVFRQLRITRSISKKSELSELFQEGVFPKVKNRNASDIPLNSGPTFARLLEKIGT